MYDVMVKLYFPSYFLVIIPLSPPRWNPYSTKTTDALSTTDTPEKYENLQKDTALFKSDKKKDGFEFDGWLYNSSRKDCCPTEAGQRKRKYTFFETNNMTIYSVTGECFFFSLNTKRTK